MPNRWYQQAARARQWVRRINRERNLRSEARRDFEGAVLNRMDRMEQKFDRIPQMSTLR